MLTSLKAARSALPPEAAGFECGGLNVKAPWSPGAMRLFAESWRQTKARLLTGLSKTNRKKKVF
jgi:hypothetical protein